MLYENDSKNQRAMARSGKSGAARLIQRKMMKLFSPEVTIVEAASIGVRKDGPTFHDVQMNRG
jgi:hypothetical protein